MNPWEEDWTGASQRMPWEEDWEAEAAPAPRPRFQPTDENGIPRRDVAFDTVQTDPLGLRSLRAAAGLPDATGGLYGGPKKMPATGDIFNKPMISSADDIRNADLSQLDSPRALATDKMSRSQSIGMGVVDYGRQTGSIGDLLLDYNPGTPAGTKSALDAYRAANQGVGPIEQGFKNIVDAPSRGLNRIADGQGLPPVSQQLASIGDPNANSSLDRDFEQAMTTSLQDNPFSTRIGQIAAMTAGGGAKATEGAIRTIPRMAASGTQKILPQAAAKYVASNVGSAKALRYGGRLAALGGISGADYAATNAMSEATNQARLAGGPRATTDDRVNYTASELDNPFGYAGAIVSPIYRGLRFGATTVANSARATAAANRAAPRPEIMAAGLGKLPTIKYQGGSFTPSDVEARVAFANTVDPRTGKSLREKVIDDFIDQGFDVDQAETAVRIAAYNGVSEVPEALFEISPALQEIAVAAGRLHGKPAQKMLQQMFTDRKEEFPNALREALRKATGASGDDFEEFVASMKAEGRKAAEPGYQKAHAATISDQTWQNIVTMLRQTPDGVDAAKRGAQLARNSARMRPEYVQAAEELEALRRAIAAGQVPNGKLSTLALDFLDRGINRKIKLAMSKGDADYAGSLLEFRNAFRGSGLDADTGLNVPRTLYAQYKAVAKAAEFGEKAAGKTTPLRLMKSQFVAAMKQADEAFEEGIGEGSSIIDTALLQGWIRGAENFIETADNAQTAIRQLYGSERQREKLLAMMRELPEGASSGLKADNTKRIKALVGSKPGVAGDRYDYDFALSTGERKSGSVELPSLFSRQKNMLESERLVTGGSPTSGASEALDNQLRQRNSLETLFTMAETAINSPARTAARVIDSMRAPPLLRDPEASAIIGELLTTRGKDRLLAVIAEIRARKLARDGGSNTAPPTGPRPPPSGGSPTPSTPIAAGGFSGLRTDLGAGVGGALFAGAMPMEEDATLQDKINRAATGFVLGYGASKGGRVGARMLGRNALAGETRTAGMPGSRGPIRVKGMSKAEGNKHGLMPHLRMQSSQAPSGKAKLVQDTNAANASRQIDELDGILAAHPNALNSPQGWAKMMADALGSDDVPVAPYAFIRDVKDGTAQKTVQSLTPGQIADADHGFANAAKMKEAYFSGRAKPSDTGALFAWGFLSRGVSPYTQESLFIDAFNGLGKWIDDAANGTFDIDAYLKWAKTAAPAGSNQPGAGASHNLNAFGSLFLQRMSEKVPGKNITKMEYLHNLMSDPNMTGPQIRREFARIGQGVGIDNKVVSFTLLVSGRDDVMVLDRVQIRKLWNDGRFDGMNLYDGHKVDGAVATGSALSNLTYGARGLLVYEAIERHLAKNLKNIYAGSGREANASIGRYHWETWVADSQQEASHGTIDAVLRRMVGDENPMAGVVAKQGEYGSFSYGARYGRDEAGQPFIDYPTPSGSTYRMTPQDFAAFREDIKKASSGIIPSGKFKVSDAGDQPWYNKQGVNKAALDDLAARYGVRTSDGSVSGTYGGPGQGQSLAGGRQNDFPGGPGQAFNATQGGFGPQGTALPPIVGAGFTGFDVIAAAQQAAAKPKAAPKPTVGKPKRDIGTKVADASAIAALSLAPPAQAQGGGSAELDAANERVRIANERVLQIEKTAIPKLQGMLEKLQDPNGDPKEKQRVLIARGHDLGKFGPSGDGVDGDIRPGGYSARAIAAEQQKIQAEIAFERQELEKARKEEADARDAVTQAELRMAQQEAEVSPMTKALREIAPWAGTAAGIAIAGFSRRGAVAKSRVAAQQAAARANALLNASTKVSRAQRGPDALSTRAANLNEFWRLGGAGENVPFKKTKEGKWTQRPKPMEPSRLFPAEKFPLRSMDAGVMAGGALEAGGSQLLINDNKQKADKARQDIQRYADKGDLAGVKRAQAELEEAENMVALATAARNLGLMIAGGRGIAALKMPYAQVRPGINMAAAEDEQALLLSKMKK